MVNIFMAKPQSAMVVVIFDLPLNLLHRKVASHCDSARSIDRPEVTLVGRGVVGNVLSKGFSAKQNGNDISILLDRKPRLIGKGKMTCRCNQSQHNNQTNAMQKGHGGNFLRKLTMENEQLTTLAGGKSRVTDCNQFLYLLSGIEGPRSATI